jgi:hypothetical protein
MVVSQVFWVEHSENSKGFFVMIDSIASPAEVIAQSDDVIEYLSAIVAQGVTNTRIDPASATLRRLRRFLCEVKSFNRP